MTTHLWKAFGLSVILLPLCASATNNNAIAIDMNNEQEWNFRVYLDDREIGYHNFRVTQEQDSLQLTTAADFEVKFLFITAYQYQHRNTEVWRDGCLQAIDSNTNANGRSFLVNGAQDQSGFSLETNSVSRELGDCVKTFAYWNPEILQEAELLNAQTGELLGVQVSEATDDVLTVAGRQTPAMKYHLSGNKVELDVWYSDDWRWLALESTVKGGRKLRYELNTEHL